MAKKAYNYFETMEKVSKLGLEAATELDRIINNYDAAKLSEEMTYIHKLEQDADAIKHELMEHLTTEFLPPIEREDIVILAQELDNVVDYIDDTVMKLDMYKITSMKEYATDFSRIIIKCANALTLALADLPKFKNSKTLKEVIIEVNTLEGEGDALYIKAMENLFSKETDAVEILKWHETYAYLEKCCDACEHVANTIESIIMKNS